MDTLQFLVTVFLILLKFEESTMQNLTFYNTPKTWKYAANFCSHKGGVLESNVTLLKELDEFKSANEDVWIGKFKTLTNWTYIQGCYSINGEFQHFKLELDKTLELQCQMLCEKYKFYSIKEEDCYCIANISSFVRNTNCTCVGCYKVWEHRLLDFGSANRRDKCIAVDGCVTGKLKRSYETCTTVYYVTCDNGAELGYIHNDDYHAAAEDCERRGSFIKWYSNSSCVATSIPQYWTSGTRSTEIFLLRKPYFTENFQPEECYILKENGGDGKKNCNEDLRFVCRFETDEDEGNMISIPNLSTPPQKRVQSDDSGNIAAGIVTSIIVVIAVISVLVFIYLRRIHSRDLLSLSTIVKDEPSPSRMDSNTANAAYEQLNKTDKDNISHCQSYDQLIVHEADKTNKHNTRISSEDESKYESIDEPIKKYHNALPAEYEQLERSEIVKTTNVYDPLHYTPLEDPDPTNARSNNIVSREVHRKYGTGQTGNETHTNVVPLEYEQLDIKKNRHKHKSV
ncbi:uncharacterized protein LOC143054268 [Mytilus galloprovincialis]|uniref:uncharacterized protein LOC143054268 n=1 Tax=Mytilus galloprovincialis TaxID=29158 RepID=UPI003F7C7C9F